MPSTFKHPAHVPMWRGAKVAYLLIAMCLFPVAIGGYWAYGNLVSVPAEAFFILFSTCAHYEIGIFLREEIYKNTNNKFKSRTKKQCIDSYLKGHNFKKLSEHS